MGRLDFIRKTAPAVVADPRIKYCLVDYSCPEASGDWLEHAFPEHVQARRVLVERVPGHTSFNKCKAMNAGARRALREGAEYLLFLDADTVVKPGFVDSVVGALRPGEFQIIGRDEAENDGPNLIGVLALSREDFEASGGWDENFVHWGCEDIEFRLRLYLLQGLVYREIPLHLLASLPHSSEIRFRFSVVKDAYACMQQGWAVIHRKLEQEWRGRMHRPFEDAERLCTVQVGRPPRFAGAARRAVPAQSPRGRVRQRW